MRKVRMMSDRHESLGQTLYYESLNKNYVPLTQWEAFC